MNHYRTIGFCLNAKQYVACTFLVKTFQNVTKFCDTKMLFTYVFRYFFHVLSRNIRLKKHRHKFIVTYLRTNLLLSTYLLPKK